jgi:hypothetical protein
MDHNRIYTVDAVPGLDSIVLCPKSVYKGIFFSIMFGSLTGVVGGVFFYYLYPIE